MKRIAILGPESTGKSNLSIQLAQHFQGQVALEQARDYLAKQGNAYQQSDLNTIAHLQFEANNQLITNKYLFADTEMYVVKIWSEYKYNTCDLRILNLLSKQQFDLYLLMQIDLPWTPDAQREHPSLHHRKELFNSYAAHLVLDNRPFVVVDGIGEKRLQKAIQMIEQQ